MPARGLIAAAAAAARLYSGDRPRQRSSSSSSVHEQALSPSAAAASGRRAVILPNCGAVRVHCWRSDDMERENEQEETADKSCDWWGVYGTRHISESSCSIFIAGSAAGSRTCMLLGFKPFGCLRLHVRLRLVDTKGAVGVSRSSSCSTRCSSFKLLCLCAAADLIAQSTTGLC